MTTRPWLPLIIASLLVGAACSEAAAPGEGGDGVPRLGRREDGGRPPIVLITLDTLRADRLALYGHGRPTSTQLEALASTATLYTRAHSPSPWTLPSHASLFTGRYPFEHGAHRHVGDGVATPRVRVAALAEEQLTLAEVLADAGYATGAVVANESYLRPGLGLDQGFASYDNGREYAPQVNARALAWLDDHIEDHGDQPFLLFLNYMDVHQPYNIAPREGFVEPGTRAEANALIKRLRGLGAEEPAEQRAALLERLDRLYELAVANLDDGLGRLFDELRNRGLFDRALIVVTSDHGELFGEHGLIEHGDDVYQGLLHVPLLVKAPGQRQARVDERLISLVHVPALVLEQVDLPADPAELLPFVTHWPRAGVFAENHKPRPASRETGRGDAFQPSPRVRRVLFEQGRKYIHSSDGAHELFDLTVDPNETSNLVERQQAWARQAASEIERLLDDADRQHASDQWIERSEEQLRQLRELGYVDEGD